MVSVVVLCNRLVGNVLRLLQPSGMSIALSKLITSGDDMSKRRILIIDDESAIRLALERMLVRAGYDVVQARDGLDALSIMLHAEGDQPSFDLLILDMQMPGLSGLELIDKLYSNGLRPLIQPIAGAMNDATLTKLKKAGCALPVEKPFSRQELLGRVEELLSDAKKIKSE